MTADLPAAWRTRADELERYAPAAAEAFRAAADELEEDLQEAEEQLLPPAEAAAVSGLSERTLRERRAKGLLKDLGTPGRPLYRKGDLPRKAARSIGGAFDADSHVREILS